MLLKRERSFNLQLIWLSVGLLVPTLIFVGVLLWQFAASERYRAEQEASGLSRNFAVALDREINGVLTTLQALATSPSLQNGDFGDFYKQAKEVSRLQGINISLRDTSGHAYLTTRAAFGEDVGVPALLAQADQDVIKSGKATVSNIFTSTVASRPVFQVINAPVLVAGKPKYMLGASIDVGYLADVIRQEHLPTGWIGSIIDRNGVFVARTERQKDLAGKPASADYRSHVVGESGRYYGLNSDGNQVLAAYSRSALTGWMAATNVTTQQLDAPLRRSLMELIGLGLLLAALASGMNLLTRRRLMIAFDRLMEAAADVGHGRPVKTIETPIAEVNKVGLALQTAAQQRDVAETELRHLTNTLEARVDETTRERNRLWETTNDLVGTGHFDGRLLSVNPAWSKVLGWSEEELLSRPFSELIALTDRPNFAEALIRLRSGENVVGRVDRALTASGAVRTIFWNMMAVPEQNIFYVVGRDLTEQRQAEEQLHQSQKIEAMGQLTGGIAHDFNNMLAVIIGSLNLAQRRVARGETNIMKYVDGALDGALRASSLTHRLLAFSRQQPLAPEAIDPNKMVGGLTDLLSRTLGQQNRIETVLSAGLWRAKADPNQLENVVLNLAVNARDAMPEEGGRLTIETANAHIDDDYAREHEIASGQYVLIAVSDTGGGMTPEVVARAFDPFFTTKEVGKGTGLGLSQVFGFARQSGGHVKIYSEVGHGTTVKLYLPRFYGEPVATKRKAALDPICGGDPREIILVVEDEDRVRNLTIDALRDLGYTVIHASNAPDALQLLAGGEEITLLFTDVVMPGMTGRQLVDAISTIRPEIKVLYTTGYSRNAIVHNGVLDPGTNFIAKPFGIEQLAIAVRQVLDS